MLLIGFGWIKMYITVCTGTLFSFMRTLNGVVMFKNSGVHHNIHVDASLESFGGVWGSRVYSVPIPFKIIGHTFISQYEMYNILLALWIWGPELHDKTSCVHCDNESAVTVVKTDKTKDFFRSFLRNIWPCYITICIVQVYAEFRK